MEKDSKIFIIGHEGLPAKNLVDYLKKNGFENIIIKLPQELMSQTNAEKILKEEKPDYIFLFSVKEGGILANIKYPADLIYFNLQVQKNIIHYSYKFGVKKLLFLGSSCMYPKFCKQPMKEEYLLTGLIEPTNEFYAIAKIAGIKMCQAYNIQYKTNFISAVPANVYGPYDDFNLETSHVIPALIRKFHNAKINKEDKVIIWGTGSPRREFIYISDLIDACIFLMDKYNNSDIINIGTGKEVSIKELANLIKNIVGYEGKIIFDKSKPDGMPRKILDSSKINSIGWKSKVNLEEGIKKTYDWYLSENYG